MRTLLVPLLFILSVVLIGCGPGKHRPIDVYLTVESDYGSPNPPVGDSHFNWGTTVTASVDSPVASETEGTRYVCTGWTGAGSVPPTGSTNSVSFVITQNSSITWLWKIQYELTIEILPEGSGMVEVSPAGENSYYDDGEVVTLTANPNGGYVFAYWSGDLAGAANPQNLTMDAPKVVVANFALIPVADFTASPTSGIAPLTVQFTDASTGIITSWAWDFDNNGTVDSTDQSPSYIYNNGGIYAVKLTVTGPGGSHAETKTDYIRAYTVIYVDGGRPDDTGDGLTWVTAKKLIQSGINAASNNWLVLVANGIYTGIGNKNLDFGGKTIYLNSVGGAANCIIDCENSGRGFYFHRGETAFAVIEGFTIRNGNADYGGVYCYFSSPIFVNCLILGNKMRAGGGVYCTYSNPRFTNCTISGNSASDGGGVFCSFSSNPTFRNSVIWGNTANWSGHQIYVYTGSSITLSYSCYANGTNDVASYGTVTPNNCINLDPDFVDAASGNYRLEPTSPCIDIGNNSYVPAGVTTDLDGNPRIQNGTVDMGAYEYQP
jgi:PKD repeat protein